MPQPCEFLGDRKKRNFGTAIISVKSGQGEKQSHSQFHSGAAGVAYLARVVRQPDGPATPKAEIMAKRLEPVRVKADRFQPRSDQVPKHAI
jgi:hypothetical protein